MRLAGILSSPLLAGLLPVCKLLAMYRESNEMKEAGWTTILLSLQGTDLAIGLHFPGQLLGFGPQARANLALNHCFSSAMRLEISGPVPSSAVLICLYLLFATCDAGCTGSSGTQP